MKKSQWRRMQRHLHSFLHYMTASKLAGLLRTEWEYRTGRTVLSGKPYVYVIDPTNFCNLRCRFCPTWKGTLPLPKGQIALADYEALLRQIKPYAFKVVLYNWGEPFLHKSIADIIRAAHEARVGTTISSNMNCLPRGLDEEIVKAGLDHLILSINGLSEETYQQYHEGGRFEAAIENVRRIVEAKRRRRSRTPHLEFQFLVFRHNEHEAAQVGEFSRALGCDSFRLAAPYVNETMKDEFLARNPAYVLDRYKEPAAPSARSREHARKCFWLWRAMVINWNGDVDPCCGKNALGPFANVLRDGLERAWNSEHYIAARRLLTGQRKEEDAETVCNACVGYDY
ncbi:MAG: radical SAM protein [Candidatus Sumerlaeota bacterium]|nr:radical SAM protein [Candidatus Sumerlaeota bacterium]